MKHYLVLQDDKTDEVFNFASWRELYNWCKECLENDIYSNWCNLEDFERRGYEDCWHWFEDLSIHDTTDLLSDSNHTLTVNNEVKLQEIKP